MTTNTQCATCGFVNLAGFACSNCVIDKANIEHNLMNSVIKIAREYVLFHTKDATDFITALRELDKFKEGEK